MKFYLFFTDIFYEISLKIYFVVFPWEIVFGVI